MEIRGGGDGCCLTALYELMRSNYALERPARSERHWTLISASLWRCELTSGEKKMLARGVVAGTFIGLAIGGMIALVIAMKPELFAGLIQ